MSAGLHSARATRYSRERAWRRECDGAEMAKYQSQHMPPGAVEQKQNGMPRIVQGPCPRSSWATCGNTAQSWYREQSGSALGPRRRPPASSWMNESNGIRKTGCLQQRCCTGGHGQFAIGGRFWLCCLWRRDGTGRVREPSSRSVCPSVAATAACQCSWLTMISLEQRGNSRGGYSRLVGHLLTLRAAPAQSCCAWLLEAQAHAPAARRCGVARVEGRVPWASTLCTHQEGTQQISRGA